MSWNQNQSYHSSQSRQPQTIQWTNQNSKQISTCTRRKAQEKVCKWVTTCFDFTSDWMTKWCGSFTPIVWRGNARPVRGTARISEELRHQNGISRVQSISQAGKANVYFFKLKNVIIYLSIVSLQVPNVLECCRGVQLNNIAMHSSKEMTAITERTLQSKSQITSVQPLKSFNTRYLQTKGSKYESDQLEVSTEKAK